jgi:hypothetical protein
VSILLTCRFTIGIATVPQLPDIGLLTSGRKSREFVSAFGEGGYRFFARPD